MMLKIIKGGSYLERFKRGQWSYIVRFLGLFSECGNNIFRFQSFSFLQASFRRNEKRFFFLLFEKVIDGIYYAKSYLLLLSTFRVCFSKVSFLTHIRGLKCSL